MTAVAPPRSRNDPCPCGSGLRYKHCHGREGPAPPIPVVPAPAAATFDPSDPIEAARAALRARRPDDAVRLLDPGDGSPPADPVALRLLAEATLALDPERSRALWTRVLDEAPDDAEALFFTGELARAAGDHAEAIARFERALLAQPDHPALLNNLGLALEATPRSAEAPAAWERVLAAHPDDVNALANLAQFHYRTGRHREAIPLFRRVIARLPDAPLEIWVNLGVAQMMTGQYAAGEATLEHATRIAPDRAETWRNLGALRFEQKRWGASILALERAIALDPDDRVAHALRLHASGHEAYWRDAAAEREALRRSVEAGGTDAKSLVMPFVVQSQFDDPALEQRAARQWGTSAFASRPRPRPPRRTDAGPLRIAFVSSDLHEHCVGRLLVGLLDRLDRSRFEPMLYATGAPRRDAMRERIRATVTTYRDLEHADGFTIADAIRADRADIAFDLNGYTGYGVAHCFGQRPAPVQVNFLGYTGTLGQTFYDWILADRYSIPPEEERYYDERLLAIEPCYLPSDPAREIDATPLARRDYRLPEDATVFAAHVATYKITPDLFDDWMAILLAVPGSVLWLREESPNFPGRMREHARTRDVDPSRLVFAKTDPIARYLARFRLADLFLDSFPFGSHTTVSDALFAGLPVLARAGRTFGARASASQVRAAGMPELVATDREGYRALAIRFGRDRDRLRTLAEQLRRREAPLFDIDGYARRFENALERAWAETPID